jgi:hypothetical protein
MADAPKGGGSMGRWWGFHLDLMLISDVAI